MKKKLRNLIGTVITILLMAVMLPIQANAAVTVVSGDGSDQNPYAIVVGGITNEFPFTYNLHPDSEMRYYYASRLTLKSTETVKVTLDDQVNDTSIERTKDGPGKAAKTFIVRGEETVYLKISARKSGTGTMKITVKPVSLEEYCPSTITGTHDFYSGACRSCKYKCKHPKDGRKYSTNYEQITVNGVNKHMPLFTCNICNGSSYSKEWYYDEAEAQACTAQKWTKENADQQKHHGTCTVCGKEAYMPCEYEIVYKKYDYSKHYVDKKCKVCGGYDGSYNKKQKHTFKKNVCTKCKFKRVVPGALKIKSLTGKVKSGYVTIPAHWSGNYWIPAKRRLRYTYEISCNMNAKNAAKYILADTKTGEHIQGIHTTSKKKRVKVKFTSYKRMNKYTVYAYAVSKTGTPSKVVKKVVKFS